MLTEFPEPKRRDEHRPCPYATGVFGSTILVRIALVSSLQYQSCFLVFPPEAPGAALAELHLKPWEVETHLISKFVNWNRALFHGTMRTCSSSPNFGNDSDIMRPT